MEFLGILFIVIIIFIIGSFVLSLNKDKNELKSQPLEKKFRGFVHMINNAAFKGTGSVSVIDKRSFNLYRKGENQIINFHYGTGHLTITWSYKFYQKEVGHKRSFNDVRNLSVFKQQELAERMIMEMEHIIEKHKSKVLEGFHSSNNLHNSQGNESIGVDLSPNDKEIENSNFGEKRTGYIEPKLKNQFLETEKCQKEPLTRLGTMRMLKARTLLTTGVTSNVRVTGASFVNKQGQPFRDPKWNDGKPYAIVNFGLVNEYGLAKSKEHFNANELQEALNTNESMRVSPELGKALFEAQYATVIGKESTWITEDGFKITDITIDKVFPENLSILKNELNKFKNQDVEKLLSNSIEDYMNKELSELIADQSDSKQSIIRANNMLEITDLITSTSKLFKKEFNLDRERLNLTEEQINNLVDDVTRKIIEKFLKVDLIVKNETLKVQTKFDKRNHSNI